VAFTRNRRTHFATDLKTASDSPSRVSAQAWVPACMSDGAFSAGKTRTAAAFVGVRPGERGRHYAGKPCR